ncbi:UbiA family prenyltransferase [Bradymonas sediminis]|uniref:Uncharacterized protein n=1 Tax=Bradymonas sediminis TaxID=1548548 RepID=A0A2Z4FFY4_9DELT|nr:UbiA family prenyltransferase [Bradymonas sediminis]AWV87821.1 hypothetical protein DN745_00115 [Bradymonas sediminis]TDP73915.1 UbiA prenyltransferase family protein [Bradymonas sediminis]
MRLLIFSNIYISLAAAALTVQAYYVLGARAFLRTTPHAWGPAALVFCATLMVYNLDRLVAGSGEDAVDLTERHRWIQARKRWLWGLVVLAGVAGAATLFVLPLSILAALIPLGLIAGAYSLPLLGRSDAASGRADTSDKAAPRLRTRRRLKDIPGLKIFLIALVWAAVTVILPALHASVDLASRGVLLTFVARMLFIFAITLPFDIRDMRGDAEAGIRTLPMLLGPQRTRLLALALMLGFCGVILVHYGAHLSGPTLPLLLSALATSAALLFCARPRPELYYVGLLDGTMLLQPLLVIAYLGGAGLGFG